MINGDGNVALAMCLLAFGMIFYAIYSVETRKNNKDD